MIQEIGLIVASYTIWRFVDALTRPDRNGVSKFFAVLALFFTLVLTAVLASSGGEA